MIIKSLFKLLFKHTSSQGSKAFSYCYSLPWEKNQKTQQQPNRREWSAAQSAHHFLLTDFLIWLWFQSLGLIFPVRHISGVFGFIAVKNITPFHLVDIRKDKNFVVNKVSLFVSFIKMNMLDRSS